MNKKLLLFLWLLIGAKISVGQAPSIQWQKCFGGTDYDIFFEPFELDSSVFLLNGGTWSNDGNVVGIHGAADWWLVQTNGNGIMTNQRCYGGSDIESGHCFIRPNGGVTLIGYTTSNNGDVAGNHQVGTADSWFVESDSSGNVEWQRCYGGLGYENFFSKINTNDGGYILAGHTTSIDGDATGGSLHGSTDCWIVRLDSSKNILWNKCYGGSNDEGSIGIFATPDSCFVVGGCTNSSDGDVSYNYGDWDYWLFKIDANGNMIWEYTYGGSQEELLTGIVQCNDGGYMMLGSTYSIDGFVSNRRDSTGSLSDLWVVKTDSDGIFQWQRCYGGNGLEDSYGITKTSDGGFIICGSTNSNDGDVSGNHGFACAPFWCSDAWIVKLDSSGSILWQKCMGGSDGDVAYNCIETTDGGYLVAGQTFSFDGDVTGSIYHGNGDAWVVKLSPLPDAIENSRNPITDFTCRLNSAQEKLTLKFYSDSREKVGVTLLDITGRTVVQKDIETTPGLNKNELRTGPLSNGIYLVQLETANGTLTKKVAVE